MGIAVNSPTKLLAYDTFLQEEGALKEKELPLGGKWGGAGDTDDFTVGEGEEGSHVAKRSAKSDANINTGRYALAGSEEPTTAKATVDVKATGLFLTASEIFRRGVFLRYTNTENWLMAHLAMGFGSHLYLKVIKRVAGTTTTLGEVSIGQPAAQTLSWRVALQASAEGTWSAWAYESTSTTEPAPLLTGQDSALATGGTLAKGKCGIYDAHTSAESSFRNYDNFSLLTGDAAGRVCFSGKNCRITSGGFTRQDSTGAYEGEASLYRGANLYLKPGLNRIVIAMRRTDADTEASPDVTDRHSVEVLVRERYLAPR